MKGITTDLYCKPTDSHKYLNPNSSHPKHTFKSIVYGGALRLKRICSNENIFEKRVKEFRIHLTESGYQPSFIDAILRDVSSKKREELLIPSPRDNTTRIPFVTTYHPLMPNPSKIHNEHKIVLDKSDRMRKILPDRPIVALRRLPNLGSLLIRTKSHIQRPMRPFDVGFNKCGDRRCHICSAGNKFGNFDSQVKSNTTKQVFKMNTSTNCNTSHCVYLIACRVCGVQYVGQSIERLRLRFNNHRSSIRNKHKDKEVAIHFNLPGHSEKDIILQCIEAVPPGGNLDRQESRWLWNLKCHKVNGGLNLKEPFFKHLCLEN